VFKLIRITTVPESLSGLLKGQLKYMSENGFEVIGVSSPGERLYEVTKEQGVKAVAINMTRTISLLKDFKALVLLIRLFHKEKPDIVHTHTPKAGTLGMIAAWLVRVPHRLHTVAGLPLLEATGRKRRLLDIVERITYACATGVYPNSIGLQSIILKNNYASKEKLKVIGNGSSNGIDTSEFNPSLVPRETCTQLRHQLGVANEDFVFLFVGRIVTDKGVNELAEAFELVNKRFPNTHLIIVGRRENHLDPLKPGTEKIIESHPNIHAVGFKRNIIDYFAAADVLVFPSYREGFPNVVMQAAAMQLNAIVSDINGCNEIIKHGENGWLIPTKDIVSLQERMEWCVENCEQSKQMALKSRCFMQSDYERSYVWSEILKEYKSLLKYRN